jgi:hypothetical protein
MSSLAFLAVNQKVETRSMGHDPRLERELSVEIFLRDRRAIASFGEIIYKMAGAGAGRAKT